jgi:hypothetical protein
MLRCGGYCTKNSSKNTGGRVSDYVYNRMLPGYIEFVGSPIENAFIGTSTPLPLQQDFAKGRRKQVMYIALFHFRGYVDFVESPIETGDTSEVLPDHMSANL